jgi:8-oxo-dGTP pyrophosphatase MutT (NUDIX family)
MASMKHLFDIVDCLVERDGKFLIVQETGPGRDGLYNVPGGHIDEDETLAEAAMREVFEETGYQVELTGVMGMYQSVFGDRGLNVGGMCYLGRVVDGDAIASAEHPEVRWVTTDELLELVRAGKFWSHYVGQLIDDYKRRGAYPLDAIFSERLV